MFLNASASLLVVIDHLQISKTLIDISPRLIWTTAQYLLVQHQVVNVRSRVAKMHYLDMSEVGSISKSLVSSIYTEKSFGNELKTSSTATELTAIDAETASQSVCCHEEHGSRDMHLDRPDV